MDNSIWNTFIQYDNTNGSIDIDKSTLIQKISFITNNLHKGLYNLNN